MLLHGKPGDLEILLEGGHRAVDHEAEGGFVEAALADFPIEVDFLRGLMPGQPDGEAEGARPHAATAPVLDPAGEPMLRISLNVTGDFA